MKKLLVFVLACMLLLSTAAFAASAEPAAETGCSHAHVEEVITKAATCEEKGEKEIVCLDCGEVVQTVTTAAVGHNYVETVVEPTCEAAGYTAMTCTNCGDSYAVKGSEVPALGHNYVTVQETTCAHDGIAECANCHEQVTIAATAHAFVYNNDAVTGADGSIVSYGTKTCSVCGAIEPAAASDYVAPVVETASAASGEASAEPSGEASGEAAAAEEAAATEVSNPDYDPYSYNWSSICWILVIAIVAIGAILMLSFGKKKPDEVHADPLEK